MPNRKLHSTRPKEKFNQDPNKKGGYDMSYFHCDIPALERLINYVHAKSFYMCTRNVTYIKLGSLSN